MEKSCMQERYQISYNRDQKTQGVNDDIDAETRHTIRNFHVTQTVCISYLRHCIR